MNHITQLNPKTCPKAIAEIFARSTQEPYASKGYVVLQGLAYQILPNGDIWNVGNGLTSFVNNWTDQDFKL